MGAKGFAVTPQWCSDSPTTQVDDLAPALFWNLAASYHARNHIQVADNSLRIVVAEEDVSIRCFYVNHFIAPDICSRVTYAAHPIAANQRPRFNRVTDDDFFRQKAQRKSEHPDFNAIAPESVSESAPGNGSGTYPFTDDCSRIENGSYTAKAPPRNPPPADGIDAFAMDCMGQFKLGYYFVVQSIHHRRYPVVDRERGVVWSHAVFDQGTVNKGVLSTGKAYEFKGFNRPSSILVTEAFLIENGKIRRVEMVGPSAQYHMNSAWPGSLSGN